MRKNQLNCQSKCNSKDFAEEAYSRQPADRAVEEKWVPICADDPRPLIPPGDYFAVCTKGRKFRHPMFKREVIALHFQIFDGLFVGTPLERYYPATKRVGRNSTFLREWTIANQDRPPLRQDRLPLNKFTRKLFLVRVETIERAWDGRRHSSPYSKVAAILSLEVTNEETVK